MSKKSVVDKGAAARLSIAGRGSFGTVGQLCGQGGVGYYGMQLYEGGASGGKPVKFGVFCGMVYFPSRLGTFAGQDPQPYHGAVLYALPGGYAV